MRISDWSSDVCSSDLDPQAQAADLRWARRIGLKSKCAVFAEQVPAIHAAFTPDAAEVRSAQALALAYEAPRRGEPDAGARIDPPDYNTARRLLARHAEFENWHAATQAAPEPGDPV